MKSARRTRRVWFAVVISGTIALSPVLSACNNNPTIPGWNCGGYHYMIVPAHTTLSQLVYKYVHYSPHNNANTNDIVRETQVKYGYLGGIHEGQKIRIPWGCTKRT